jgi:hypothetical protein
MPAHCISALAPRVLLASFALALAGCVQVPPEVIKLHEKEAEITRELKRTHLALVDSYVNERLLALEKFYFGTYGPAYLKTWKQEFKRQKGRDYDEAQDFAILHEDLIAEYQDKTRPIETLRADLKAAVTKAYDQFGQAHGTVGAWLASTKKLSDTQRTLTNQLLQGIDPKLSLESIDQKIASLQTELLGKIN